MKKRYTDSPGRSLPDEADSRAHCTQDGRRHAIQPETCDVCSTAFFEPSTNLEQHTVSSPCFPHTMSHGRTPAESVGRIAHIWAAGTLLLVVAMPVAYGQVDARTCGSLANAYGPFDYRTVRDDRLGVVEKHHFNSNVELLVRGQTGTIGGDLFYVLRAFPNHHRALISLSRLAKRMKATSIPKMEYPVECFFERALRFRRDDTTARLLYAGFLHDHGRTDEAVKQIDAVIEIAKDQPYTQYNAGLVLLDLDLPERALAQAHRAMSLGFERPELRARLEAAGKWRDPPAPAEAPAMPAAGADQPPKTGD